ncbi:MAG: hypothetical protein ACOCW8_02775 [bacterium]
MSIRSDVPRFYTCSLHDQYPRIPINNHASSIHDNCMPPRRGREAGTYD